MCELYGANQDETELLLALTAETRNERKKSWWHDYTETALPQWFGLFVSLEDSAEIIQQYESELVPGLLQTRAYAEQVTNMPPGYIGEEEIQRRVDVRMERQSLLTRPRAPHLNVVLNEAVIRRPVGGDAVMAEQLDYLRTMTQRAGVSIRILPWSVGVHSGMGAANSFAILNFPNDLHTGEPLEPPLVYVDTLTGAMYLNKPDETKAYHLVWQDLEQRALDPDASNELITAAREGFASA